MVLELVKVGETGVVTTDEFKGHLDVVGAVLIDIISYRLLGGIFLVLSLRYHFLCTLKDVVHLITSIFGIIEILLLLCI